MMGRWMARAGRELLADADALVLVPLHWRRRWHDDTSIGRSCPHNIDDLRGPYHARRLKRILPHRSRSAGLEPGAPITSRGHFLVLPEYRVKITGRRLVLVDDVLTSGATVDACTRTLLRAGAAQVDVLVFAQVVAPARSPI